VIQNIIDAKTCRDAEWRTRDADEQRQHALDLVRRVLEVPDERRIGSTGLNLGQAWDGIQHNQPEWLAASQFGVFEDQITRTLQGERSAIHKRKSVVEGSVTVSTTPRVFLSSSFVNRTPLPSRSHHRPRAA
jgi:hypothetical protein